MKAEKLVLLQFKYYVFFQVKEEIQKYVPIISGKGMYYEDSMHIWDTELNNIIPALWYALHLPRTGFDTRIFDIDLILSQHDEPQNIVVFPYNEKKEHQMEFSEHIANPAVIICEDSIYEAVINDKSIQKPILNIVKISDLSEELLKEHWKKLRNYTQSIYNECEVNNFPPFLTNESSRGILPLIPMLSQFEMLDKAYAEINKFVDYNYCINLCLGLHSRINELARLEEHCKGEISNLYVWRALRRIGKLLSNALKKYNIDIVQHISQITVFSDFPIGLAILPNCTATLCCIKPISYRPLTPLTKAFQYEMTKSQQIYLGGKLKILVAECVNANDKIRKHCDALTKALKEMVEKEQNVTIIVKNIETIEDMKLFLNQNIDAGMLLISAHGQYLPERNMAALIIGNSVWMAEDDDLYVPPVVLLSACHVMPRDMGAVCVGDAFLRAGAKTVLGTFIPVDVRRNAILIIRLFTDIFEVRRGWSNMRTLDEIWSHVVSTNAIHEIIASSSGKYSKLEIWANQKKSDGTFPQGEFKGSYSVGKLRGTHIYKDTEKVMRDLAYRDGIGQYFDSYINSNGYFPESVFYQLVGTPENIFFRNRLVIDK